jgi:hypothetical protein
MNCDHCGYALGDVKFCTNCGQPRIDLIPKIIFDESLEETKANQSGPVADKFDVSNLENLEESQIYPFKVALSIALIICCVLPWSSQVNGYSLTTEQNIGIGHYSWAVLILLLAIAQLIEFSFLRLSNVSAVTIFKLDFVNAVIGMIAVVGASIAINQNSQDLISNSFGVFLTIMIGVFTFLLSTVSISNARSKGVHLEKSLTISQIVDQLKTTDQPKSNSNISIADELKKFAGLRDEGIISESEFDAQRKKLLGG